MTIIKEATGYGSEEYSCEFELTRALTDAERATIEQIANECDAWVEVYSFPEDARDVLIGQGPQGTDIWREGCKMLHFVNPHPLIVPEVQAALESFTA